MHSLRRNYSILKEIYDIENDELIEFCSDVLEVYEKHGINGHIVWEK